MFFVRPSVRCPLTHIPRALISLFSKEGFEFQWNLAKIIIRASEKVFFVFTRTSGNGKRTSAVSLLDRSITTKYPFYSYKKPQNCCRQSCCFWLKYAPNRFSARSTPQAPPGSLQRYPTQTPSCFGEGRIPRERGKKGKGTEKRGGKREKEREG